MIKSKSEQPPPPRHEIDLTGEDGNAFALIAYATRYAEQLDMEVKPIINEMTAGGNEQLVEVFDRHFGHFVTLYR